jgi:hypothetical protein
LKELNESAKEDPENAISDDLETSNFQDLAPLTFTSFLRLWFSQLACVPHHKQQKNKGCMKPRGKFL